MRMARSTTDLNRNSYSDDLLIPHDSKDVTFGWDLLRELKDAERTMGSNIPIAVIAQQGDEIAAYGKASLCQLWRSA